MKNDGYVKYEANGHKAVITFFHSKGNSLPLCLLDELTKAFNKAAAAENVSVVLLRSEGESSFCAGASFDELLAINNLEIGKKFFSGFANLLNSIRKCSKFVIARVQGKAVGGGVGLIACCDYAMALKSSAVKLSELAVGIGPFVIAPAIERKVGKETLSAMTINFEWRSAEWAYNKGLYDDIFNSIEELDKEIEALVTRLSDSNPAAIKELKRIFWEGTENWDDLLEERAEISGRLVLSAHTKKYIDAFRKKSK
ncbi:MAG: enoyl-CoA hydratase/isomerase family protein [Melioribacteraceae bacterium]|nr:enoyl-CoA hydratase/isomerase family protein [Melioribacteraceae bacterium]